MTSAGNQRDVARIVAPGPVLTAFCAVAALVGDYVFPVSLFSDLRAIRLVTSIILFAAFLALGMAATYELRQQRTSPSPYEPTSRLATSGVYRLNRNPIYTGFVAFVLGFAPAANSLWFLVAACLLFVLLHYGVVKPEERYLSARFGAAYTSYCQQVGRWL